MPEMRPEDWIEHITANSRQFKRSNSVHEFGPEVRRVLLYGLLSVLQSMANRFVMVTLDEVYPRLAHHVMGQNARLTLNDLEYLVLTSPTLFEFKYQRYVRTVGVAFSMYFRMSAQGRGIEVPMQYDVVQHGYIEAIVACLLERRRVVALHEIGARIHFNAKMPLRQLIRQFSWLFVREDVDTLALRPGRYYLSEQGILYQAGGDTIQRVSVRPGVSVPTAARPVWQGPDELAERQLGSGVVVRRAPTPLEPASRSTVEHADHESNANTEEARFASLDYDRRQTTCDGELPRFASLDYDVLLDDQHTSHDARDEAWCALEALCDDDREPGSLTAPASRVDASPEHFDASSEHFDASNESGEGELALMTNRKRVSAPVLSLQTRLANALYMADQTNMFLRASKKEKLWMLLTLFGEPIALTDLCLFVEENELFTTAAVTAMLHDNPVLFASDVSGFWTTTYLAQNVFGRVVTEGQANLVEQDRKKRAKKSKSQSKFNDDDWHFEDWRNG